MRDTPRIALIATLDTKGEEIAYVRSRIRALGAEAVVIDSGILGEPSGCEPDVSREEVARAAGKELDEVRGAGSRGAAVEQMQVGVRAVVDRLWGERAIDGVLCLGGAGHQDVPALPALPSEMTSRPNYPQEKRL